MQCGRSGPRSGRRFAVRRNAGRDTPRTRRRGSLGYIGGIDRYDTATGSVVCDLVVKQAIVGADGNVGGIETLGQRRNRRQARSEIKGIHVLESFVADLTLAYRDNKPVSIPGQVGVELPIRVVRPFIEFAISGLRRA